MVKAEARPARPKRDGGLVADRNALLHARYQRLSQLMEACVELGDVVRAERVRADLDAVGAEFFAANQAFARQAAGRWSSRDPSLMDEYLAAAYEQLWRAFLTWDPSQGTFTTWSRTALDGAVRREVRRQEYGERSYEDFTARTVLSKTIPKLRDELGRTPSVDEIVAATGLELAHVELLLGCLAGMSSPTPASLARASGLSFRRSKRFLESHRRLSASLGRAPTAGEISADTGMSRGVVERALYPKAARLDAPVRSDEGTATTLGDRIASSVESTSGDPQLAVFEDEGEWLTYLSEALEGLSGQEVWFLLRAHGLDGAWPQTIRDLSVQTDIGRESARRVMDQALAAVKVPLPSPLV